MQSRKYHTPSDNMETNGTLDVPHTGRCEIDLISFLRPFLPKDITLGRNNLLIANNLLLNLLIIHIIYRLSRNNVLRLTRK